ncbi:malate transporter [Clostridia bacterium]|nr:malate transporter [Clostridia bacterium]
MAVFQALGGVASIFLIVIVGFVAAKTGRFHRDLEGGLAKLSSAYAIPALIFHNTVTRLSPAFLSENLGVFVFLPFGTILLGYGLARFLGSATRLPAEQRGPMSALFSMSNVVFIGVPVCSAVFGSWATPYVISYLPANTILFWTIGNLGMMRGRRLSGRQMLANVFSPPLLAFIAGMPFVFFDWPLPGFVVDSVGLLGGMGTPAALLTVGGVLSRADRQLWKLSKFVGLTLIGRSLVMPLMMFAACRLTGAPPQVTLVYTTISCMPVMSQAVLQARKLEASAEQVAHAFAVTTLCTMVCVPIVVTLLRIGVPYAVS